MKLQQLSTKFNVVTNSVTLESKSLFLYDDYTKFVDFGMNDNESYISICVDDEGTVGYIYASTTLWTNTAGEPTKCHAFDYMGGNGVVMHAYTKIPNETDELVETFTNSSTTVSLEPFNLIDNIEDFPYGAMIYLVSSKGNNGSNGSSGGGASTYYSSKQYYVNGTGGAGGSSGAPGKGVLVTLELAEFLSDGTPDFDNTILTGTIRHEGEGGAAGGGGGGGAGWKRAYRWDQTSGNKRGAVGSGGTRGYANVASRTNKIRIPRNVAVKCSSFLGHTGSRGTNGYNGTVGYGGTHASGNTFYVESSSSSSYGGNGGAGGSYGSTPGSLGSYNSRYDGGKGGNGASVSSPTTKTTVNTEINGKPVYTVVHTNSSDFTASNNLASTGGMALTRIIPIYDE